MTIALSKNCIDCGKPLTTEEQKYYRHTCDSCERIAFDKSLHDDVPDTYEVTTPPQGEPIRFPVTMVTLRDQFAMAALTGLLAGGAEKKMTFTNIFEAFAILAFNHADAMLKARGNTSESE